LRLDLRRVTAISLVSQAVALFAMTQTTSAVALFIACAIFGVSAGNLVSLPALIIQREFETTAIGQFTYAFGPGLLGVVRDATGGYSAALALCIALQLAAAGTIRMPRFNENRST
jgi:cyanate permease